MAIGENFPKSPYKIIEPKDRWYPGEKTFEDMEINKLLPPLVQKIRKKVKQWRDEGYPEITETSKSLLYYWFNKTHFKINADGQKYKFKYYFAQREAIESIIYLYEKEKVLEPTQLIKFDNTNLLSTQWFDEYWTRYVCKLATGTGKTKLLSLVVTWAYYNKIYEKYNQLSSNFLIIAPNIIVLDRLKEDFDGLKIFYEDPLIPENGYKGRNWKNDFQLNVHIQDNVSSVSSAGNLFLTNIQRIYTTEKEERNSYDYLKGNKPVYKTTDSNINLIDIIKGIDDLIILNDEAHHIHDSSLAWFQTIEDIHNNLKQKNGELSLQLDVTATPKDSNGTIFPQTICNYPLVEAIHQNILKAPIIPDEASRSKLSERQSDKFVEQYEDYIHLAYLEWKKSYEELRNSDKTPILFVMTEDTKTSDEVAKYMQNRYKILNKKVLTIHTKRNGQISEAKSKKKQLNQLREAANKIDSSNSSYLAIVSVLMLREGWDVRNVTTILGLRAFSAKSKILPEQALGRGLRLMFPENNIKETVSVIGTEAFLDFVEGVKVEGVELKQVEMTANSKGHTPIAIEIDKGNTNKNLEKMNIKIPRLAPRIKRQYKKLEHLDLNDFNFELVEYKNYNENELDKIFFKSIHDNKVDHSIKFDRNTYPNYQNVVGYFTKTIMNELRLVGGFDILFGKVKKFIKNYLFNQIVDLQSKQTLRNLSELKATKTIIENFKIEINKLTIVDTGKTEVRDYINIVKDTSPYVVKNQEYIISDKKSLLNKIVGDSHFELEIASLLEEQTDIISFIKNSWNTHFRIEYINTDNEIAFYIPDFVIKNKKDEIWILETKGREDLNDPLKIKRLKKWCDDVNQIQNEIKYNPLYIKEEDYDSYKKKIRSFEDLIKLDISNVY